MSLDLSKLEKKAVAKVLIDMMNADGKVTVGEIEYFQQLQNVLGISNTEIEEAKYMSVAGCLSILRELLPHEKLSLLVMMLEMIRADGDLDDTEMKLIVVVCAAADIPVPEIK